MSENRTAAEIEAEIEATREALTRTVNELAHRVSPATQVENVKKSVARKAQELKEAAAKAGQDAGEAASQFVRDVKNGDRKALAILGAAGLTVGAAIAVAVIRKKR